MQATWNALFRGDNCCRARPNWIVRVLPQGYHVPATLGSSTPRAKGEWHGDEAVVNCQDARRLELLAVTISREFISLRHRQPDPSALKQPLIGRPVVPPRREEIAEVAHEASADRPLIESIECLDRSNVCCCPASQVSQHQKRACQEENFHHTQDHTLEIRPQRHAGNTELCESKLAGKNLACTGKPGCK